MPGDREVLEAYCRAAAVTALADLVRERGGVVPGEVWPRPAQLELVGTPAHRVVATPVQSTTDSADRVLLAVYLARGLVLLACLSILAWVLVTVLPVLAAPLLVLAAVVALVRSRTGSSGTHH